MSLAIIAFAAGVLFAVIAMECYTTWKAAAIGRAIEDDLGFEYGTPYTDPEDLTVWDVLRGAREVITLERVVPGKPMAEAGVKSGDVLRIPNCRSPSEFIGALERSRGGAFAATVERNGKEISVVVRVPRHGR